MTIKVLAPVALKAMRDARLTKMDWSYDRLSFHTKISAKRLSLIERGLVFVNDDDKKKIAAALDCSVEDLFV